MRRALRREISTLLLATAGALALRRPSRLAAGLALGAAALRWWPSAGRDLRNRVVLITGGSRGLGLALAECFLSHGAFVALLARDEDELQRAEARLNRVYPGHILTAACDVTEAAEFGRALRKVRRMLGRVDILINNAGIISVGPLETMTREDFDKMLELSVHAVVQTTQQVRPMFLERGGGHVVNICSVGGKVGVPHMAAYCAGKFALSGLSTTMAAELGAENIYVTTVYPGVMRVGSPIQGEFKGDPRREYGWFATGSLVPGLSISAKGAASRIVDAVRQRDAEVMFPLSARAAAFGEANFPEISALLRGRAARFFPDGGDESITRGMDSRDWLEERWWFRPFRKWPRRLERRWNQTAPDGELPT